MSTKPAFIFVPGAWHGPELWDSVIALVHARGYPSTNAITLPSTTGDPNTTLLDDIHAVQAAIEDSTTDDQKAILVLHSYGGFVGESALAHLPSREKVLGLALMGTGFTQAKLSFLDCIGGKPPPFWRANTETGFAELVDTSSSTAMFYHDLAPADAAAWTEKLRPHSLRSLAEGGEHVYEGWRDVPMWYLITREDRGLPLDVQRWLAGMVRAKGADVTVREVDSGHSPMLSRPEEVVEFLVEAARALAG